jgi:hypothetical protein
MAIDFSKLMKKKQGAVPPGVTAGAPPEMAGMGALVAPPAAPTPKRKPKPKKGGGKRY